MKKFNLILFFCLTAVCIAPAQFKQLQSREILNDINNSAQEGTYLNHFLLKEYLDEYIDLAANYGINIIPEINKIKFILIEPASGSPQQWAGVELGRVEKTKKMILLSNACLLDSNILKAILFRELSHYMGVPYNMEGFGLMALTRPEEYSYGWLNCATAENIRSFELECLFREVNKYITYNK